MSTIEENLLAKTERFASFLVAHAGPVLDMDQVAAWGDVEWARIAEWMNELCPGRVETMPRSSRRFIVASLRRRLTADDPFDGLPA